MFCDVLCSFWWYFVLFWVLILWSAHCFRQFWWCCIVWCCLSMVCLMVLCVFFLLGFWTDLYSLGCFVLGLGVLFWWFCSSLLKAIFFIVFGWCVHLFILLGFHPLFTSLVLVVLYRFMQCLVAFFLALGCWLGWCSLMSRWF